MYSAAGTELKSDLAPASEVDRLVAELLADLPRTDPSSFGDSPSFSRRRWIALRQATAERLVPQLLAKSTPPIAIDSGLEDRVLELVDRLLHPQPAGATRGSASQIRKAEGAGI